MTTSPVPVAKRASRTKTATQAAAKPAVKVAAKKSKAAAPAVEVAAKPAAKAAPAPRQPASKLVRDSFTIPHHEYETLAGLKRRSLTLGTAAKKSELIRAGILALSTMADGPFLAALQSVPNLKTGRPKKHAK